MENQIPQPSGTKLYPELSSPPKKYSQIFPGLAMAVALAAVATVLGKLAPIVGAPVFAIVIGIVLSTLMTRSPIALAVLSSVIPWFRERARKDEERLEKKFGQKYIEYRDSVPRWVPIPQIVKDKLSQFAA